jgi:hypothetical protein
VFLSDNPCTAADNEYGFSANLSSGSPLNVTFYYSDYTNCSNSCYSSSSSFTSANYNNQATGSVQIALGLDSVGSALYTYQAYLTPDTVSSTSEDYAFVVSVIDPYTGSPTTCQFDFGSGFGSSTTCSTTVHINPSLVFSNFADIIAGGSYNSLTNGGSSSFSGENYMTAYTAVQIAKDGSENYPNGMSSSCSDGCGLYALSFKIGQ